MRCVRERIGDCVVDEVMEWKKDFAAEVEEEEGRERKEDRGRSAQTETSMKAVEEEGRVQVMSITFPGAKGTSR